MTTGRSVYISPYFPCKRIQFPPRTPGKMTKLQIINTFVTERLMSVLNEIMDMIGGTVLQYERDLEHLQKDNEHLRRRLREIEKLAETTGPCISTPEPASPPRCQLKWTSSFETEMEPAEIYSIQNQVPNNQLPNTKLEDSSGHAVLVTESDVSLSCATMGDTLAQFDNRHEFETSALKEFPCNVKTEPTESPDLESTNANAVFNPLPHCTVPLSSTTEPNQSSDPLEFSISNSRTELESDNLMNSCSKLEPRTFQMSISKISPNVLKTTCPESGISQINYNISHQNTDSGSARSSCHNDSAISSNACVTVNPVRHVPFNREVRRGRGRGRGKGPGTHICPQCGKLFPHHSRLKVHMRIHTGEKPYACAQCGKRFNNDGTLRNHSRVHLQLRLFDCPVCARSFKDAYTCRNHMRVHARAGHTNPASAAKFNRT